MSQTSFCGFKNLDKSMDLKTMNICDNTQKKEPQINDHK